VCVGGNPADHRRAGVDGERGKTTIFLLYPSTNKECSLLYNILPSRRETSKVLLEYKKGRRSIAKESARLAVLLRAECFVVLFAPPSGLHFEGALPNWTDSKSTVLVAEPVRCCRSRAIRCLAACDFAAAAVVDAESSCLCFGDAAWMHTHRLCIPAVFVAESSCVCFSGAACWKG
jgi:hypothetical protein